MRRLLLGLFAALLAAAPAGAQTWPTKPIRLVVGYSAGGGNDLIARIVAARLQEKLGQPVLVDNKPGAQSIVAAELVAKALPDGYTLLVAPSGPMTINPAVYAKLPYAPDRDFAPISLLAEFPLLLNTGRVRDQWHTMTRTGAVPRARWTSRSTSATRSPRAAATRPTAPSGSTARTWSTTHGAHAARCSWSRRVTTATRPARRSSSSTGRRAARTSCRTRRRHPRTPTTPAPTTPTTTPTTTAAVDLLAKTLATEWGPQQIRVNAIAPTVFRSELTAWMYADDDRGRTAREAMFARIPLKRFAEPEDFVGALIYLLSDASTFLTGQVLYLDGGYTAC